MAKPGLGYIAPCAGCQSRRTPGGAELFACDGKMPVLSATSVDLQKICAPAAKFNNSCPQALRHLEKSLCCGGIRQGLHDWLARVRPFSYRRVNRKLAQERRLRKFCHFGTTARPEQLVASLAAPAHEITIVLDDPQLRDANLLVHRHSLVNILKGN